MQLKVSMQWTGSTKSPERWVDGASALRSDTLCSLTLANDSRRDEDTDSDDDYDDVDM